MTFPLVVIRLVCRVTARCNEVRISLIADTPILGVVLISEGPGEFPPGTTSTPHHKVTSDNCSLILNPSVMTTYQPFDLKLKSILQVIWL